MRSTRLGILLGVLAAGACLAMPSVASAQAPTQDSVVGSGTTASSGVPRFGFELDARSGPSGENPTGTAGVVLLNAPELSVRGRVTCLTVTGNRAVIGIENTLGTPGFLDAFLEVTDGTPDTLEFLNPGPVPTTCPSTLGLQPAPVVSGDIVVIDARPFPTSKDECKNGGWRNFGATFKNQGACVSFVTTGGKNPPAGP